MALWRSEKTTIRASAAGSGSSSASRLARVKALVTAELAMRTIFVDPRRPVQVLAEPILNGLWSLSEAR